MGRWGRRLFGVGRRNRRGRGGFGEGRRAQRAQRAMGPRPRMLLAQAHQMLASGDFRGALEILTRLAEKAEQRGIPERAAQLNLEAGRALLELGDGKSAFAQAQKAVGLFAAAGLASRAAKVLPRVIQEFRSRGFNAEADALQAGANQHFASAGQSIENLAGFPPSGRRGTLPGRCPHCGGELRPDEVEWLDESTVECEYCGSVVKAQ